MTLSIKSNIKTKKVTFRNSFLLSSYT